MVHLHHSPVTSLEGRLSRQNPGYANVEPAVKPARSKGCLNEHIQKYSGATFDRLCGRFQDAKSFVLGFRIAE